MVAAEAANVVAVPAAVGACTTGGSDAAVAAPTKGG